MNVTMNFEMYFTNEYYKEGWDKFGNESYKECYNYWAWWLSGRFGALHLGGRRFKSTSHHVGTLGKSFTHICL